MDTLRADHLGAYGYDRPTSPNLDQLASQGARFSDASSTSAWTTPAHASIFTGRYPHQVGIVQFRGKARTQKLRAKEITLAEVLKGHGYETQAFTGDGFIASRLGFDQGFDRYRDREDLQDYFTELDGWLQHRNGLRPFFAFVHFYNCHRAYTAPQKYARKFRGTYNGTYPIGAFCRRPTDIPKKPEDRNFVISQYDATIAYGDHLLGKLFASMRSRGLDKNTLVVFLSDHGDEFFEHGGCDHIHSLYQELIHVPLILKGPGIPQATTISTPVSLIDIMPTVLDYAKIPLPKQNLGQSLLELAKGKKNHRPVQFFETANPKLHLRGMRLGDRKLIFNARDELVEAYDLRKDPQEKTNLAAVPEFAQSIEPHMDHYRRWRRGDSEAPSAPTDAALREQLESLGYVE